MNLSSSLLEAKSIFQDHLKITLTKKTPQLKLNGSKVHKQSVFESRHRPCYCRTKSNYSIRCIILIPYQKTNNSRKLQIVETHAWAKLLHPYNLQFEITLLQRKFFTKDESTTVLMRQSFLQKVYWRPAHFMLAKLIGFWGQKCQTKGFQSTTTKV